MLRYVGFLWNADDSEQSASAQHLAQRLRLPSHRWHMSMDAPGLKVFHAGARANVSEPYILRGGAGVVFGTLFMRNTEVTDETPSPRATLSENTSARISSRGGRDLIDSYWGSYVAFLNDGPSGRKYVVRSPMDAPPCYWMTWRGVRIYFSFIDDILHLESFRFSINWSYVGAHMAFGQPHSGETGLNEVSELRTGEAAEPSGSRCARNLYWNPCAIARSEPLDDFERATTAMRATTRACVNAWVASHGSILHRLSGGLDSSVVLGCLSSAPSRPQITCVHYFSNDPFADERQFARLAATQANCDLVEQEGRRDIRLDGLLAIAQSPIPTVPYGYLEHSRPEADLAYQRGATAVFWGDLGDALFHQAPTMPAAAEYVQRKGIGVGLLGVAADVARLERVSIATVLRAALHDSLLRKRNGYWSPYEVLKGRTERFLSTEANESFRKNVGRFVHPWLHDAKGVPLGKLWQIHLLPYDISWRNPFANSDDPQIVAPLVSQPLAELCIRIPTYLNVKDGWDRAVARQAFSNDIPREISRRLAKGTPDGRQRAVIAKNMPFIKELLLDGVLVREGLLDRPKLEKALSGLPSKTQFPAGVIMVHLCTEIWARTWSTSRIAAAA